MTLSSGLQFLEIPGGFQVTAPQTQPQPDVLLYTDNLEPRRIFVFSVDGTSPWATSHDFSVTLSGANGDERAFIFFYMPGPTLFAFAPADLQPGPVLVKVTYQGQQLEPVIAQVGVTPWPNILQAASASTGVANSGSSPAFPGDTITLTVQGLSDTLAPMDLSSINVSVGGVPQTATLVQQDNTTNTATVRFILSPQTQVGAAGSLPLTIAFDGRDSTPFALAVAPH